MNDAMNRAQVYEDFFVPYQFRPFARDFVARAAPQPGDRVLDIACGTGIVARLVVPLLASSGAVVGLDLNPSMLAVARECAATEGLSIQWQEGDAAALDFADASFDLIFCHQGIQYVPDKGAALREMRRVLRPGGRAFISTWAPLSENYVREVIDRVAREHIGVSSLGGRFGFGDAHLLRILVEGAGFAAVTVTPVELTLSFPSFTDCVRAMIRPDLEERPAEALEAMVHAVAAAAKPYLSDYLDGAGLRCPTVTNIAEGTTEGF